MKHYRFGHGTDPQFRIASCINGCAKIYRHVRTFRCHIRAKHEDFWVRHVQNPRHIANVADEEDDNVDDGIGNNAEEHAQEAINYEQVPFDVNHEISSFLLNLRENYKTSQASCSFVANEFVDSIQKCRESIELDVHRALQRSGANIYELNDFGLAEAFQETKFEKAFSFFSSHRNIDNYVANQCNYVEPCLGA